MNKLPDNGIDASANYAATDKLDFQGGPQDYAEFAYDRMTVEDVKFIVKDAMRRIDEHVDAIVASTDMTWQAIGEPLNEIADIQAIVDGRALMMSWVHPDEELREAANALEITLYQHLNDVWNRRDLYEKLKAYGETRDAKRLKGEERMSYEATMYQMKRQGHELTPSKRRRLAEINRQLTRNSAEFDRNLSEDDSSVTLTADELAGLPPHYLELLERDENGGFVVQMKHLYIRPILQYVADRETRRRVKVAYDSRAKDTNRPLLEETLALRRELAGLLGYPSWAHYAIEPNMAETPEAVIEFFNGLYDPLVEKAAQEKAVLTEMLHADGYDDELRSYDKEYYAMKLAEWLHDVDHEKVAEYFPIDAVVAGMFEITSQSYGITYRHIDVPVWHEDVVAFAIDDEATGEQLATFYLDLFPRDGKYTHAAAYSMLPGREMPDGSYRQPVSAMIANLSIASDGGRALQSLSEVADFAHELGHILHQTLTKVRLVDFSGSKVEIDFVETPSQVMENLAKEPEILWRISRHYETGEKIPLELLEGAVASLHMSSALDTLGEIALSDMDLAMHGPSKQRDLDVICENSWALSLIPREEGTFYPASFIHLMNGYEGQSYAYLWSRVDSDDIHEAFRRKGFMNREFGMRYRRVVQEQGGTKTGAKISRELLGRKPNQKAFLRNLGITALRSAQ